ncbi:MAG: hypothetical protein L0Z51_08000 [Candidatus Latescibacteria bacterium]|nr:hypothetical protein [Candidatus Latescibacterota bacterium]
MPKRPGLPLAESIRFGWRTVRDNALFLVGTIVVAILVPSLIDWGSDVALDEGWPQFALGLIELGVSATLSLGLAKIYLRFRDGERPVFENLFDGIAHFHKYLGASIIVFFAVMMGLVLLVVPGIVFLIRLWFLGFVIVDTKVGPLEAIQQSWDVSRGHTRDLFFLFFILVGVNLLGLICLGVGVLISLPVSGLALAHIYRILRPRDDTPAA